MILSEIIKIHFLPKAIIFAIVIIFSTEVISQDAIIIDSVSTHENQYLFPISIETIIVGDTILLTDSINRKFYLVIKKAQDMKNYYFDFGGNKNEGVYTGAYTKDGKGKITVHYRGSNYLTIINGTKNWEFNLDNNQELTIPIEFYNKSKRPVKIKQIYFDINHFNSATPVCILEPKSDTMSIMSGLRMKEMTSVIEGGECGKFAGSINFIDQDNIKYKRSFTLNVRDPFWFVFRCFILFLLISEGLKHYSNNEKKINLLIEAQKLYLAADDGIPSEHSERESYLKKIKKFISKVNMWLLSETVYRKEFNELKSELGKIIGSDINPSSTVMKFISDKVNLTKTEIWILRFKKWTVHFILTLVTGLIAFNLLYSDNMIFGSDCLMDYLKLFSAAVSVSFTSGKLISERLEGLQKLSNIEIN